MAFVQQVIPMLAYEDGVAALNWLINTFGFEEKERWLDDGGRLTHGEVAIGNQRIMLASPSEAFQCPNRLREAHPPAAEWLATPYIFNGVLVLVNDVEALYDRVRGAGVEVLTPLEDGFPGKRFRVADFEGNRWMFKALPVTE